MAVQIQYGRRPSLGSQTSSGDEAGRAATTPTTPCGTWSVPRDGVIVHHVELALHPDQPGMDKERPFELAGDELTLHTQPVATPAEVAAGLRATHESIVPGYHLNKKHWITVTLGGDAGDDLVRNLIEDSHDLVGRRR